MRWLLIDEFIEIRKGSYAQAVKNVTRSDDALTDSFPAFPMMFPSLMLEMMAQVGGVLAGVTMNFAKEVVLAKISDAEFLKRILPPSTLEITGHLLDLGDDAARTSCEISCRGERIAKADIFFGLFESLDIKRGSSVVFSPNFMETYAIKELIKEK